MISGLSLHLPFARATRFGCRFQVLSHTQTGVNYQTLPPSTPLVLTHSHMIIQRLSDCEEGTAAAFIEFLQPPKTNSYLPSDALPSLNCFLRRRASQKHRPLLHYSTTPLLHYSTTPLLHYSTTPLLHYSTTPLLLHLTMNRCGYLPS